jgi:N utilization substance protein A
VNELKGEKVDVVQHRDDLRQFIAEALGPARVQEVIIDDETKTATVIVSENQLSLAIGKEGQNARLAARLSGYRIDIRSDQEDLDAPDEDDETADESAGADSEETAAAAVVSETGDDAESVDAPAPGEDDEPVEPTEPADPDDASDAPVDAAEVEPAETAETADEEE